MKKLLLIFFFLLAFDGIAQPPEVMPDYVTCDDNNDGFAIFDLTSQIPAILNGLNPNNTVVTFYELFANAQVGANPITPANAYTNLGPNQTVYIRAYDTNAGQAYFSTIHLVVTSTFAGYDGNLTVCDSSTAAINLFDLIASEQPGGTWTRTSGTGGTLNGTTGIYTPVSGSTTSSFMYTTNPDNSQACQSDTSEVFIIFQVCNPQPVCGGNFTDAAGVSADYAVNSDATTTICPTNPGDKVTVTFTAFNTETNYDALYVFNGNSIAAPQISSTNGAANVPGGLAGGYWGTAIPGPFTSTSTDGCLTFRFRSDNTVVRAGWVANVTCAPPPNCVAPTTLIVDSVTHNSISLDWAQPANPDNSVANSWEIFAFACGSPSPTDTSIPTAVVNFASNYVLTGLLPATCYSICIRAVCSNTSKSSWICFNNVTTGVAPPVCGGQFVDNGGLSGNYANNSDATTTICPEVPGDFVTVTFTAFNVEANWDALYVFNGNSISAPQIASNNAAANVPGGLAGGYWGTVPPEPFTSTSNDGCLTFRFRSDNTANRAGWLANVTCGPPPTCPKPTALSVSNVTSTTASLNWQSSSAIEGWEFLVLPLGVPAPLADAVGMPTSVTPALVTGLMADTCYTFYVRAVCSETDKSAWAGGFNFCTQIAPPACGGQFVDNGGVNANYANNSDNTYTICPTNPGEIVRVAFSSFNVETNWDALYVFDGNSISAPQIASSNAAANVPGGLAGGYWGTINPGPFTSTSPDGCLTFRFRSDNSGQRAGWVASVNCIQDSDKIVLVAYIDANSNGIKDTGEQLFSNGEFIYQQNNNGTDVNGYSPTGQFSLYDTNAANTYSFSYEVQPEYAPYFSSGTTTYSNISIAAGSGSQFLYFPITLIQSYNDVTVSLAPVSAPRPGMTYINRITYTNLGIETASGVITFAKPTQITTFTVSQTGTVTNVSGFTYTYTSLLPGETRSFLVTMTVPATVNVNELLTDTVSITSSGNDINLTNNSNNNTQIAVNSFDPNDKLESRGKTIPFNQFTQDDYFFYTIRFQNNGTADAIDVRIEDLLNAKIDESTVLMISASHNYTLKRVNNQLVWEFKNIFLTPSSLNESGSKGYVQFKVKLKPGFQAGDIIPNNASIYFDTNPAIVTATFNTKFTLPLGVSEFNSNSLVMHPNPAQNIVQLDLINTNEQISKVVLYDLLGKTVKTMTTSPTESLSVDVSDLARGMYLVEITSENKFKVTKKLLLK